MATRPSTSDPIIDRPLTLSLDQPWHIYHTVSFMPGVSPEDVYRLVDALGVDRSLVAVKRSVVYGRCYLDTEDRSVWETLVKPPPPPQAAPAKPKKAPGPTRQQKPRVQE